MANSVSDGKKNHEKNDQQILSDEDGAVAVEYDESQDMSGVPIDRGWAWMAVLGCFGIHVFVVGGAKSLGVLIVEIRDRFEGITAKEMGLVQGLMITITIGLALVTNLLSARFTCRAVVFLGGLLACLGFTLTAFVTQFWMIYLTYSIMTGLGFALAYTPSIVFVGSHFEKRRSLANGLSLAGSGVGSFALPNLMRVMLKEYGLPGCCMLMGALMLHVCICGLLFRPHANYRKRPQHTNINSSGLIAMASSTGSIILIDDVTHREMGQLVQSNDANSKNSDKSHKELVGLGEFETFKESTQDRLIYVASKDIFQTNTPETNQYDSHVSDSSSRKHDAEQKLLQVSVNGSNDKHLMLSPVCVKENYSQMRPKIKLSQRSNRSIFDWSLLTNPVFFLYFLFAFFVNVAYPNVFFMLPVHAENEGEDRDSSALLLSFIGITDLLGRLVIGWFSDLKLLERRYILVTFAFASGLLSLLMPVFRNFGGMAAYAVLYGFCAGCYVPLIAVTLSDTLGPEKLTSSLGLVSMALAATLIPAPIICGQIRDSTGSWNYAFVFVGAFVVFGSLFPLLQPCLKERQAKPNVVKETITLNSCSGSEV
ncbi:monocarboxylate transporter [Elysia marginata]|uniref:Monocarboxylate transporter n=1 Tax=Elysia marginata TaxID=1093978 RepID=A0AAV4IF34_9GAST|nr:monocarboxylate transporter [Elysia marginata]